MLVLLAALMATAAAQDRESVAIDSYTFTIASCDRIRARTVDDRPADAARSHNVVVVIRNTTDAQCTYTGLVLKGWLEGGYTVSHRKPDGDGFYIPAGGEVLFKVAPKHRDLPRGELQLQIPPDRGIILLDGVVPVAQPKPD